MRRWLVIAALAAVSLIAVVLRSGAGETGATTKHEFAVRAGGNVTADLYLPKGRGKVPLVVLLQSSDEDSFAAAASVGDTMQRKGSAALAITFRASPSYSPKDCVTDVAAVIDSVDLSRFSRVVLVGRDLGAWMAATFALDAGAGVDPKRIAGVVGLRGTYELDANGAVRSGAAPFLLLSGGRDEGTFPRRARSFARKLEGAGVQVDALVVPDRDRHSLAHWAGEYGDLVLSFIAEGPKALSTDTLLGARQRWTKNPPLDNDDLRTAPRRTYEVDPQFMDTLMVMFGRWPFELDSLPGKTYEAIDLLSYLPDRGNYLIVTNIRGEQLYFSREDLEATKPVIVVGMDDETNLNRLFTPYRLKIDYSWKKSEQPMPMMVRPLGAFLHFRSPPPAHLRNKSYAPYGLTSKSFRWVDTDPLAPVRDLTGDLRDAVLGEQGCLKCHSFRGAGARAHHVRASDGKPHGAFALPLEEYPTEVLRRFLFEQDAVAKSFDVAPLRVEPTTARALFDLVTRK